ncbi:hypothetical protein [Marinitoga sp. 1138]|uniref:hypothetical protein n=1 Tax=Marinitoga sp. 1138 TaxID=1643334 RepID=UPI001586610E|nr:hypothetical protein [Marinitoga sp. 1138]
MNEQMIFDNKINKVGDDLKRSIEKGDTLFVFTDEAGDDGLNSQDKYKIIVFNHSF